MTIALSDPAADLRRRLVLDQITSPRIAAAELERQVVLDLDLVLDED